jgi:hypothetical protein
MLLQTPVISFHAALRSAISAPSLQTPPCSPFRTLKKKIGMAPRPMQRDRRGSREGAGMRKLNSRRG